jgi:hypothetical protein
MAAAEMSAPPGIGGTAASALSSIGSDLSISVSFQVALELVAGAEEASLKDDELVGVVLAVAILLAALKSTLVFMRSERHRKLEAQVRKQAESDWNPNKGPKREYVERFTAENRRASERSLLDFAILFVSIASRIALSTTVQLLASAARGRQTTRAARVITLVSLSLFFVEPFTQTRRAWALAELRACRRCFSSRQQPRLRSDSAPSPK